MRERAIACREKLLRSETIQVPLKGLVAQINTDDLLAQPRIKLVDVFICYARNCNTQATTPKE